MTQPRPLPSANRPESNVAGDIRELRELIQMSRAAIEAPQPAPEPSYDRRDADEWREHAQRLSQMSRVLLALVSRLQTERDQALEKLSDQARIADLHGKYQELAAFAALLRPENASRIPAAEEPPRMADVAPDDLTEEELENWRLQLGDAPEWRAQPEEQAPTRLRTAPRSGPRAPADRSFPQALRRA
jgi:hypothetical protein